MMLLQKCDFSFEVLPVNHFRIVLLEVVIGLGCGVSLDLDGNNICWIWLTRLGAIFWHSRAATKISVNRLGLFWFQHFFFCLSLGADLHTD